MEDGLDVSTEVRQYLLKTRFYKFSKNDLTELLLLEAGNLEMLSALLVVYWGYHLLVLFFITGSGLASIVFSRSLLLSDSKEGAVDCLMNLVRIKKLIIKYERNPKIFSKLALRFKLSLFGLYESISPIKEKWYKAPEKQWFSFDAIEKETRSIIITLSRFEHSIKNDLSLGNSLTKYYDLLEILESFLFSVISRNNDVVEIIDIDSDATEYEMLKSFSHSARPIIARSLLAKKENAKEEVRSLIWVKQIVDSIMFKFALAISSISAFIMLLGVFLFKIETSQAFLSWFAVTFSSITLSVGVSSFWKADKNSRRTYENE
jgi:hypothetical protein